MVKLNNFAQQQGFQANSPTESQNTQSQFQGFQASNQPLDNQKGFFQVPDKFLQLVPLIPFALEAMTGQKVPPMGVLADILSGVQQLQLSVNQALVNQKQIWTKLESLENNANSQLTNLSQQITSTNNSFRLLATETKKSLEFNPHPKPESTYKEEPEYV